MNFKTTYILFGVLALVLVVFGVALWLGPTGRGDTTYVLPSLHDPTHPATVEDIDTVEIERFRPTAPVRFVDSNDTREMARHPQMNARGQMYVLEPAGRLSGGYDALAALAPKDLADLEAALDAGVDWIAL